MEEKELFTDFLHARDAVCAVDIQVAFLSNGLEIGDAIGKFRAR